MVRNTVKAKTRGSGGQDQAAPLRWADVLDALAVLTRDPGDLKGLRDAVLLAVGHNTMARRAAPSWWPSMSRTWSSPTATVPW